MRCKKESDDILLLSGKEVICCTGHWSLTLYSGFCQGPFGKVTSLHVSRIKIECNFERGKIFLNFTSSAKRNEGWGGVLLNLFSTAGSKFQRWWNFLPANGKSKFVIPGQSAPNPKSNKIDSPLSFLFSPLLQSLPSRRSLRNAGGRERKSSPDQQRLFLSGKSKSFVASGIFDSPVDKKAKQNHVFGKLYFVKNEKQFYSFRSV